MLHKDFILILPLHNCAEIYIIVCTIFNKPCQRIGGGAQKSDVFGNACPPQIKNKQANTINYQMDR